MHTLIFGVNLSGDFRGRGGRAARSSSADRRPNDDGDVVSRIRATHRTRNRAVKNLILVFWFFGKLINFAVENILSIQYKVVWILQKKNVFIDLLIDFLQEKK